MVVARRRVAAASSSSSSPCCCSFNCCFSFFPNRLRVRGVAATATLAIALDISQSEREAKDRARGSRNSSESQITFLISLRKVTKNENEVTRRATGRVNLPLILSYTTGAAGDSPSMTRDGVMVSTSSSPPGPEPLPSYVSPPGPHARARASQRIATADALHDLTEIWRETGTRFIRQRVSGAELDDGGNMRGQASRVGKHSQI